MTKFVAGLVFGKLTLRQRLRENKSHSATIRRRWRAECSCGTFITVPEYYLIRQPNPKVDCGCGRKTSKTIYNEEYRIWLMMHVRTEDERHVSYKDYGGRGIKVCPEWNRASEDGLGFDRFLAFIGPRPTPGHSIDRVDVNLGYQPYARPGDNTSPIQVRWATSSEQAANKRVKP